MAKERKMEGIKLRRNEGKVEHEIWKKNSEVKEIRKQ